MIHINTYHTINYYELLPFSTFKVAKFFPVNFIGSVLETPWSSLPTAMLHHFVVVIAAAAMAMWSQSRPVEQPPSSSRQIAGKNVG